MKALVLEQQNTPFVLKDVPDPVAGPAEAVAKVLACGAGLTIQHYKIGRSKIKTPRIIGHEITAEIVAVGPGVSNVKIGDAVTAYYYLNCGYCPNCMANLEPLCTNLKGNVGKDCDGGYAEYIKLPAINFMVLPDGLDYKNHPAEIGVICDAIATPYKVNKRSRTEPGETVAVFGAGGGLGIHQVMLSKWAGARVIAVDTVSEKFAACRKAGADEVVDAGDGKVIEALMDLTGGKGVDVAIDYVSATVTLEQAIGALAVKGRMVTLGGSGQKFEADAAQMLVKELDLLGSRYVTKFEMYKALELVARG
ncbi:MAG: zinc-binding dehydrogenase, partial [Rhodospirillales bacterium]|nr:zinc-binding dehydrogenase [Rhodospirillales bacterium]